MNNGIIVAHRGANFAPENTIENFENAAKAGYKYFETDISKTKDGFWVLHHDKTIDRMTNGEGLISDYTLKEIKEFNIIKGTKVEEYNNLKIPTLEEFLEVCSRYNVIPLIELKKDPDITLDECENLLRIIDKYKLLEICYILSFSFELLEIFYKINNKIRYILNTKNIKKSNINKVLPFDMIISNDIKTSYKEQLTLAIDQGITLAVWTVNDINIARELVEFGVKFIITDSLKSEDLL